VDLPIDLAKALIDKYELLDLELSALGVRYAPDMHRYVFPIYDRTGSQFGEVLRRIDGSSKGSSKSYTYAASAEFRPLIHFSRPIRLTGSWIPSKVVLLTEDQISAQKLSCFGKARALLGTKLNARGLTELSKRIPTPREMVVALNLLKELQLEARMSFQQAVSSDGYVVAQDPPAGAQIKVGGQVQITVGE